jgi:hypothetical protein
MPRVIETTVYKYDELSDKAKAKARDWYRNASAGDTYFAECLTDPGGYFETVAKFLGFTISTSKHRKGALAIHWTGFWSQGDGACFEGTWLAREVNAAKVKEWAPEDKVIHTLADRFAALAAERPETSGSIESRDSRYCHEYTVEPELQPDMDDDKEPTAEQQAEFKDATRALMKWMYRALETQYEADNSDEAVAETIEANEYEFLEDGKRA